MKVLVTGADGQLGRELVIAFEGWDVAATNRSTLDVTDRGAVLSAVAAVAPDVVINAAAWTAVDDCESDIDRAFRCNAHAVRHLADACERSGSLLCQISTDYVFDGTKPEPYVEWDEPNPRSVYGRSKLAGEQEAGADALVIRTSWVSGRFGHNMVKTVLRLADVHDELHFVDDQRGHPTFADDLASVTRRLVSERRRGIHHVTNQGAVSWYEFAREVLAASGADPDRVRPVSTRDMPRPAPRPANSVLDNAVLRSEGARLLDDFRVPLERLVSDLR